MTELTHKHKVGVFSQYKRNFDISLYMYINIMCLYLVAGSKCCKLFWEAMHRKYTSVMLS